MEVIGQMILLALALAVYFLPTIIADQRKHPQINPIAMLNLLGGWTFIGWLIAMVWSVSAIRAPQSKPAAEDVPKPKTDPMLKSAAAEKICPRCAETVKAAAKICRFCQHNFETQAEPVSLELVIEPTPETPKP